MATLIQTLKHARTKRANMRQWLEGYLFTSPFIIGLIVFTAYPMAYAVWLSFQNWNLIGAPKYAGFDNYIKAFTNETALLSLFNSAYYTFFAVPLQLIISFLLALALTQSIRFRDFYRAGFYLPIIVPLVASAVVWQRMFHPEFGVVNDVLGWFGISPQPWLVDRDLVKPAFIFMSLWMIGRQMVIFIAGLGNIPKSLIEAASLDGAGGLRQLFSITIPMMTPLIFYNAVIAIINSFQAFVPALIMTEGGPENATLFSVLNIYQQGFQFFNYGYAAALSWELFVIIVGFTIAQFIASTRWVYYED